MRNVVIHYVHVVEIIYEDGCIIVTIFGACNGY